MATRWAICGTGNICNDFCTALKSLPETEHKIVAVGSRDLEKAAPFAEKFGIPNYFGSYDELASFDGIDIVYVGVVATRHVEMSLKFINAGRNVLCETPMALSLEDTKRVLAAAREKNVFFQEGLWTFFHPAYQTIFEQVRSGSVGEVRMVQANFSVPVAAFGLQRSIDKALGAGLLTEVGTYAVGLANKVFRDFPENIQADYALNEDKVDTAGVLTLRYPGNRFAVFTTSDDTPMQDNFVYVRGTKGNLTVPDNFWCPTKLVLPDGTVKEWAVDEPPQGLAYIYPNGSFFKHEANAVRHALLKGLKESPELPFDAMEKYMTVLDQAYKQSGIF